MPDPRQQQRVPAVQHEPARPAGYAGDGACPLCGAAVWPSKREQHQAWHRDLDARTGAVYTTPESEGT